MLVKFDPEGEKGKETNAPIGRKETQSSSAVRKEGLQAGKKPKITLDFWDFAGQALYESYDLMNLFAH